MGRVCGWFVGESMVDMVTDAVGVMADPPLTVHCDRRISTLAIRGRQAVHSIVVTAARNRVRVLAGPGQQ
jgi:hypothetical protein